MAVGAFVKPQAGVGGHCEYLLMSALGAGEGRVTYNISHLVSLVMRLTIMIVLGVGLASRVF